MPEPIPRTVLIADPDPRSRDLLADLLVLMLPGVTTLLAGDGVDAVSVASDVCPWAVILDLEMPLLNGVDAARRLQQRMGDDVPILIGSSGDHDRLRRSYDVFDYSLWKPVDVQRLARYLARAMVFQAERPLRVAGGR